MPSKEHEALVEKVAEIAEKYGDFADSHDAEECASEIIATFRAALKEPDQLMLGAASDYSAKTFTVCGAGYWRVMFAASALGEQSE